MSGYEVDSPIMCSIGLVRPIMFIRGKIYLDIAEIVGLVCGDWGWMEVVPESDNRHIVP